jgi:uncharacterized lipoprotein NlpE involved in copper resistance
MIYFRQIKYIGILVFTLLGCDKKSVSDLQTIIPKENTSELRKFVVVDIDKCNSCFTEYGEKIRRSIKDNTSVVIILSNSKKKANIFGRDNDLIFVWDSTRYFEKFLPKNGEIFISNNELFK